MIHIAICDDRKEQIELINLAVMSYKERYNCDFEVESFENSFLLTEKMENGATYDIFLLDICMPGMLGTEVARFIRQRGDKSEIIFLTTSDEFAVDAFALKAVHYILKPFSQNEFDDAMNRALARTEEKVISLKIKNGIREINLNDIFYINSYSHLQTIYLKDEKVETRESMSELVARLDGISSQFISPCKGYVINLAKIKLLQKSKIVLKNQDTVPVSTRSYTAVKEAYFNFRFGGNQCL